MMWSTMAFLFCWVVSKNDYTLWDADLYFRSCFFMALCYGFLVSTPVWFLISLSLARWMSLSFSLILVSRALVPREVEEAYFALSMLVK